jgi:glutamate-1-semialdehyde 2,1-aminomutase
MLESPDRWILLAGVGAVLLAALPALFARLTLSRAKHRSMAGHSKWSRRIARWMPRIDYGSGEIFQLDGAPHEIAARREAAFLRLANAFRTRFPRGIELTARALPVVSDLQLTSVYRVPFPFSRFVRERLKAPSFIAAAEGNRFVDCDGNRLYDLTASYGVNVFGNDRYREWMAEGLQRTQGAGAVLGTYHPLLVRNAARLAELSGMDEVSFHMSGTEAVMQAVRLARYHTGRRKLVRFCGSYHGWWGDAQPGAGNPHPADDTYTLADLSEATLRVLETRRDIACVLVNPIQALHPNATAPADSALIDSSRKVAPDRAAYAAWLMRLRAVCKRRGIAFIIDDVFTGFRLARGGAQEYFGVEADLVTYGKTLAGGYPIGAVAGKSRWMRRYKDGQPGDVNFARGTFHSHPAVMGAMAAFLDHLDAPETRAYYADLDRRWVAYAAKLKRALRGLPVDIEHLGSVFTLTYRIPSRYNWMLQFYLRAHGIALGWTGTGRLIFPVNFDERAFGRVIECVVAACRQMQADGWWWHDGRTRNGAIVRTALRELLLPG